MANKDILYDYSVSESEKENFRRACSEVFANRNDERLFAGIGTFNEKQLHAVIKRYLSPDFTRHEIKLADSIETESNSDASGKSSCLGYVADILTEEGDIYEVQTGSLYPLRGKLMWYLKNTEYYISVVYPVPYIRWLRWIEPDSGKISPKRRCPKRGGITDIAHELYWIREFIGDRRFSLRVLFIDMEEYRIRNGWDKSGKRGSERYERIPVELEGTAFLNGAEDYRAFLPDTLCGLFTASQYAKATGIRGKSTYSMLKILCGLGLIEHTGEKKRKSALYRII
ncbi:MAG: hypothetical protein PHW77_01750 [Eubacteriales bacterium]|nr:hypothetical protein [Eubacteriales bacterium]